MLESKHSLQVPGRVKAGLFFLFLLTSLQKSSAVLDSRSGVPNPLAGQGLPPAPYTPIDFPVNVWALVTQLMAVDETSFKFEVTFIWLLYWHDERAEDLIMNNTYSNGCQLYCASKSAANNVNNFGQETCCDGVYIPTSEVANLVAFNVQSFPLQYQISLQPDGTVNLFSLVQGWFTMALDYRAYPFDNHYLCVDIQTAFAPQINTSYSGAGFTLLSGFVTASQDDPTANNTGNGERNFRPAITELGLPGWDVGTIVMDVMNFTNFVSTTARDYKNGGQYTQTSEASYHTPGVRFCIQISRVSVGFYVIIVILPVALIMLFSFGMFSLHRRELKSRISLLATLFLTLIILQFVLQTILPGANSLISPYVLILVSYIYTFLLFFVCVVSFTLHTQNLRRDAKHVRRYVRGDYSDWKSNLLNPSVPSCRRRQNDEESVSTPLSEGGNGQQEGSVLDENKPPIQQVQQQTGTEGLPGEPDAVWLDRQQSSCCFRFKPFRNAQLWWRFIGKHESRPYGEYVAHQFDHYSRICLIISYVIIVLVIFVIASRNSEDAARLHVFTS